MMTFVLTCAMVRDMHPALYADHSPAGRKHDKKNRRRLVKYWMTDYSGLPLFAS